MLPLTGEESMSQRPPRSSLDNTFATPQYGPVSGQSEEWEQATLYAGSPSSSKPTSPQHSRSSSGLSTTSTLLSQPLNVSFSAKHPPPPPSWANRASNSILHVLPLMDSRLLSHLTSKPRPSIILESTLLLLTLTTTISNVAYLTLTSTLPPNISGDWQRTGASIGSMLLSHTTGLSPSAGGALLSASTGGAPIVSPDTVLKILVFPTTCLVWGQISAHIGHARKLLILVSFVLQAGLFLASTLLFVSCPLASTTNTFAQQGDLGTPRPTGTHVAAVVLAEVAFGLQMVTVRPLMRTITTTFFTGPMVDLFSDKKLAAGVMRPGAYPAVRQRILLLTFGGVGAAVGECIRRSCGVGPVLWVALVGRVVVLGGFGVVPTGDKKKGRKGKDVERAESAEAVEMSEVREKEEEVRLVETQIV
ncbi:hypothetical protein K461DRAFT_269965 [Myriangium duriaei CBS 260.36]|uniref:Uncharacterized protein n=1 Tax=Myriangium duriaei CBS 260.36 TaxID=1168546 RepID=A0A9P4MDZ0_9PEZI|nr:hypothetical protein K461DRAFT_269965 [Myriangium duriaei CBS 260.36]